MYAIVVYDVNVSRVSRVCNFLRRFLNWVQNSVFEGELTEGELMRVKDGLSQIIDPSEDSIVFYLLPSDKQLQKEHMGVRKETAETII